LEFLSEILLTYLIILCTHVNSTYHHSVSIECYEVISIIVLSPSCKTDARKTHTQNWLQI